MPRRGGGFDVGRLSHDLDVVVGRICRRRRRSAVLRSERLGDGYRTTVVARRFGEGVFPVDVVTTFEDGSEAKDTWDGRGSWDGQDRRAVYTYERPSRAVSVRVDPERVLLLDVAYTNNSRTIAPRSDEASLKWSLKWMAWLQDLMLTYAFFI